MRRGATVEAIGAATADGEPAAVFDLDGDPSASSRVHVYERGVSGWAHQ